MAIERTDTTGELIDEMRRIGRLLRTNRSPTYDFAGSLFLVADRIRELEAELRALRDNARRARWLWPRLSCLDQRLNDDGSTSYCFHFTPETYEDDVWYADLDMAIDECSGFFSGVRFDPPPEPGGR